MDEKILELIPHRGKMVLIDSILDESEENFTVGVKVSNKSLLCTEKGVPSYCGVEYMAQSIAAFNSLYFHNDGKAKIGFILSVKKYKCSSEYFELGKELKIKVNPVLIVDKSGVFTCQIISEDEDICSGQITAYVPDNDELEKMKGTGENL